MMSSGSVSTSGGGEEQPSHGIRGPDAVEEEEELAVKGENQDDDEDDEEAPGLEPMNTLPIEQQPEQPSGKEKKEKEGTTADEGGATSDEEVDVLLTPPYPSHDSGNNSSSKAGQQQLPGGAALVLEGGVPSTPTTGSPVRSVRSAREIFEDIAQSFTPLSARLMASLGRSNSNVGSSHAVSSPKKEGEGGLLSSTTTTHSPRPDFENVELRSTPSTSSPASGAGDADGPANGSHTLFARLSSSFSRTMASIGSPRKTTAVDPAAAAEVPARFVADCKGDLAKAVAKWEACKAWRAANDIDHILAKAYPNWEPIKRCYPQALHGRGLKGEPISIETPAKLDMDGLKAAGITCHDMSLHLALIFEFVFTTLDVSPLGPQDREEVVTLTIMDCKNLSLTKAVSFDNLALIRATSEVIEKYYPGRVHRIFAVNTPRFFGPVFNVIKGALPGNMGHTIEILYDLKDLHKWISPDVLPPGLGGTGPEVGTAPEDAQLTNLVLALNAKGSKEEGLVAVHDKQGQAGHKAGEEVAAN